MEKISLYIAGKKVDLDSDSFILFNYTMEDLSNPTIVKNSFSKQITLKGTSANNEIFGNLWKADRKTIFGEGYTGVSFDPLRKTPFTIYNEMNEIIESGYIKVDSIDRVEGGYEYKVTLYGGLGSLFYDLMYDESGNKITLADLDFLHHDGTIKKIESMVVDKSVISNAWDYLEHPNTHFNNYPHTAWDIINFAPCYNGLPDEFDAKKAIMRGEYSQLATDRVVENGEVYTPLNGYGGARMVSMANSHTEWEMRNIRPYLQRVVVSIPGLIQAIKHKASLLGYSVKWEEQGVLDSIFITEGWITLGLIPKKERYTENALTAVLQGSLTPFDYLVGIAKMYGLVFLYNAEDKRVEIMSRDSFYSSNIIDLTGRVDKDSIMVTPMLADAKWYQLGGNVVGEFAKSYEENYRVKCGAQRINTGYDFNSEVKELTKDLPFVEAVDVAERNRVFAGYLENSSGIYAKFFPIPLYEQVKVQLFKDGEIGNGKDFDMKANYRKTLVYFDENHPFVDWLPKVQLHEADNKAVDGAHCILLFNKMVSIPSFSDYRTDFPMLMSDEHSAIDVFNEGKACWNLDLSECVRLYKLPSFRRVWISVGRVSVDANWGMPVESAVVDVTQDANNPNTLYSGRWKAYLTDRYDVDSRVMKCKVNLSGMQVGQSLMMNFFFYENATWVLNKISNHSITTDDLTECEFIKVKDIKNYTQGQKL